MALIVFGVIYLSALVGAIVVLKGWFLLVGVAGYVMLVIVAAASDLQKYTRKRGMQRLGVGQGNTYGE